MTATQDEKSILEPFSASVIRARERLKQAHGVLAEAGYALEVARSAAERGRAFAVAMKDQADAAREESRDIALDRSISIRNALLADQTPSFEALPALTASAIVLREMENRSEAAEIAANDLASAESDAQRAVTRAQDEIRSAAEALMLAEATDIAERIEAHDAEALALRVRLGGGTMAPIAVRGQSLTPALVRVLQTTDRMAEASIGDFSGRLHGPMRAAGRAWLSYIDQLVEHPDAELNFDEAPQQMAAE